jgi:fumiquinazoline A oxidase
MNPVEWSSATVAWNNLPYAGTFGQPSTNCLDNQPIDVYSIGLNQTDVHTFESYFGSLLAFYEANPGYDGISVVERYGEKVAVEVPPNERGVYPWRDIKTHLYV